MILRMLRRTRRREDGAALVEFALILPILVLLLFGLIDFGFIYNDFIQVRQGVRDGARVGAVANFGPPVANPSCSVAAGTTVTASSLASTQAQRLICTTRDRIGLDASKMRVAVTLAAPGGDSCVTNTATAGKNCYQDGSELVVCAMYPATSRSGILKNFLGNGAVTTRVAIRIEQTETEIGAAVSNDLGLAVGSARYDYREGALPGKNWDSFCNP